MTMTEAVARVLSNYAQFSGRAGRAEFWWWALALFIVSIIAQVLDGVAMSPLFGFGLFGMNAGQPLSFILGIAVIVPNLAVSARRLHDTNRSGWWLLIGLIPVAGILVLLFFFLMPGDNAPNNFGDIPPR
ncbi:MAG: DUF805 domain-containing protein [Pseudomonadota bacterium]